MKILSVQSAVAQGNIALYDDDTAFESVTEMSLTGKLSTILAPGIDKLLNEAGWSYKDIELYTCASGPGSFTGLRVGMAMGKGLSLAVGCAIKAVPTLDIIRYDFDMTTGSIIAGIDARSGRFYYARYGDISDSTYLSTGESEIASIESLPEIAQSFDAVIGPDIDFLDSYLKESKTKTIEVFPSALTLAKIGLARFIEYGGDDPAVIAPVYLKSGQV